MFSWPTYMQILIHSKLTNQSSQLCHLHSKYSTLEKMSWRRRYFATEALEDCRSTVPNIARWTNVNATTTPYIRHCEQNTAVKLVYIARSISIYSSLFAIHGSKNTTTTTTTTTNNNNKHTRTWLTQTAHASAGHNTSRAKSCCVTFEIYEWLKVIENGEVR